MLGKRINLILAVGASLCLLAGSAFGKPIVVHKHSGRGHVIVRPHSKTINRRSFWFRIDQERPRYHAVIIQMPYGRIIKAFPALRVITPHGVVERIIVRVWFTNTNGSRTAVELVKRGLGYIGPSGEWYREMPSTWQLQNAYGF